MNTGTPSRKECESQGSWTPATPFRPILPSPLPIYENSQANQPDQANWQRSGCFSSVRTQTSQSNAAFFCFNLANCADMNRDANNEEVCSARKMSHDCDNVEARRVFAIDPAAKYRNVSFASLLALANAATRTDELSISHQLNIHPGTMPNGASHKIIPEFVPTTPDKAMIVKSKLVREIENSCTDDRKNQEKNEPNNVIAIETVDSSRIQCNKQLLDPKTDAPSSVVSTQTGENHNPDGEGNHGVDLNQNPQQKPRRKKHRPKVAREGKPRTPKAAGLKENKTGKRKYVRKKGLNKDSTSSAANEAGEFIDLKTPEATIDSRKKTLNFAIGPTADENSKENPRGKRKYVRKKGINTERSTPTETALAAIDLKTPEPTKELCTKTSNFNIKEQTRDENSTCQSTFDLVSESRAKDFCTSKLMVELGKGIEVPTPKPLMPQPNHFTQNRTGKRKYVRKKGLDKDSTSQPNHFTEHSTGKRKYVRKKGLDKDSTSTPREAAGETNDLKKLEPAKKSCRRTLNFDLEGQPADENALSKSSFVVDSESKGKDRDRRGTQSRSIVQLDEGIEVIVQNAETGIAYDLTHSVNQMKKDYISLPEEQALRTPLPTKTNPQRQKQYADSRGRKENNSECKGQGTANNGEEQAKQILLHNDSQLPPRSPNDPKCRTFTISTEQTQACGSKRENSDAIKKADSSSLNLIDIHYHTLQSYQMYGPHFPNIYKKKRTEKVQNSATSSTSSSVTAVTNITLESKLSQGNARADSSASGLQDKPETVKGMVALRSTQRLKKRRSRGPTRVRDLASLTRIAECAMQQIYPSSQGTLNRDKQQFENAQRSQRCIEALAAETLETLARKKRTKKRNNLVSSMSSNKNGAQKQQNIILSNQHFSSNSLGTLSELTWKQMFSIDTIIERLKNLDITKDSSHSHQEQNALVPYYMVDQEKNAVVLYGRDGRLVPFQGSFDVIKMRHPRAKVELDEETNRVWKLLMQNINSEGIDGTDEDNAKWWEEERRVFHGRVDSFIARMHLVQGDRRFSQWKGSVVDSVVGVFLTQNVSDHLSSSAFMSVAANFPIRSESQKPDYGEGTTSGNDEPIVYISDPEDTIEWNENISNQPNQRYMTIHGAEHNEENETLSSNDSWESSTCVSSINESKFKLMTSGRSGQETYNDALSSQNSMDSSIVQNADRTRSSSNSNSETKLSSFNGSNSFMELLQMVGSTMLHEVCKHGISNAPSDDNSKDEHIRFQTMEYDNQREKVEDLDGPKDFLQASGISPSSFHPCLTQDFVVEVESYEMSREETRSSGIFENNDKSSGTDQTASTPEFPSQTTDAIKLTVCSPEATRCENTQSRNSMQEDRNVTVHQSQLLGDSKSAMAMGSAAQAQQIEMKQILKSPKLSRETIDAIESCNAFDNQENTRQKTLVDWDKHHISFSKELNEINDATSKPKGRRVGKEKQNDFDWDGLRRQVEVNGRKNERPENTMDSVDWEAVRCADVNKIANTIKARGMNNKLAQRIKDFLNRLVRDHGSIDLEWLRDVPPDQAKEYLLSIRGLGLKSVECVRLLTLQHLAFPVDTNVGRIAVRLGWVPLQPLPESLQLHLLELYPVLESIQKYLWPRLCKLDQRTLYELHYQMITFGKVFCTKSKPNCNACPMRGECRHFASAFASSRLALPGLEEKAMVSVKENRTDQNPTMMINQLPLPLPLPQATELSISHQQPQAETIVNNCEPIIEEPTTPEPECRQESENDIEDTFCEDPDEIPTIKLNMKEFTQTLQNYMQENLELQEGDMSKALVALTAEVASIPTPKLKNVSRLRTEHQVYELPDSHPLLEGLDIREADDPGRYLLAIWTPGEMANSIQPPERRCTSQEYGKLCDEKTCFSCNSVRESESQIVRGTLLIPCRTAMRGSFPLNGTYFQVNEVFADHDSSLKPINVPRKWIWNLSRRTVYFGTSVPTIFKGLTTEGIQHCFWRGYVCVRGFDQKTRAPRPLLARLHFPASKLNKVTDKADGNDT